MLTPIVTELTRAGHPFVHPSAPAPRDTRYPGECSPTVFPSLSRKNAT